MSLFSKFVGGIVFAVGLLIVILFPSIRDYQPDRLASTGILFGFAMMAAGAILLLF